MNNELNPVVLCEEDFSKLKQLVSLSGSAKQDEMSLAHEIARAIIVKNDSFPPNTIRIGSTVSIEDVRTIMVDHDACLRVARRMAISRHMRPWFKNVNFELTACG